MEIYVVLVTVIAILLAILAFKWKVSTKAIILFFIEKFRQPTDKEIDDCVKRTASKMFTGK